jgi:hypothetical protein
LPAPDPTSIGSYQILDRTQPSPPLKKVRLGTMTHDHIAALNVLNGR